MTRELLHEPFRMPSEWSRHARTWLAWPHNQETSPENLAAAQEEFVQLAVAIADHEPVSVVAPELCKETLYQHLQNSRSTQHSIDVHIDIPTNDAWIRDYGPTFVVRQGQMRVVDWRYNAWGDKYPPYDLDQAVSKRVGDWLGIETIQSTICAEGGALEIDDTGLLLCTQSSIVDPKRNPGLELTQIENELKLQLGPCDLIWLPGDKPASPVLVGDDTDGHIDQIARFAPNQQILHAWTDDKRDPQHDVLLLNYESLKEQLSSKQLSFQLTPLPLPDPVYFNDVQIPASYCNFYITNGSVIVPQFDRPQDSRAVSVIEKAFPNREIVGLPSRNLTVGLGSFHCLTQQQPAA